MQKFGENTVRNDPLTTGVIVQRIGSGLGQAVWRLGRQPQAGRALVLIEDGEAELERGSERSTIEGPGLCWLRDPSNCRLILRAGSAGYIMEVSEDIVVRAAGDFSGSPMLGLILERDITLGIRMGSDANAVGVSLEAILLETQTPRVGLSMVVAAHIRILLVAIVRLSGLDDTALEGSGAASRFLQHFRQLVETNFRAHWPIARYAAAIGISHDRLHAVCVRLLNKPPKALVLERLAREAGLGLEHSTLSIEQLSYALGFHDPAHFSHFFKRMTGIAPGAFRKRMADTARENRVQSPANFADWP
jgi:AraC family transcriptional regulator, transcriptional activator of pobA